MSLEFALLNTQKSDLFVVIFYFLGYSSNLRDIFLVFCVPRCSSEPHVAAWTKKPTPLQVLHTGGASFLPCIISAFFMRLFPLVSLADSLAGHNFKNLSENFL
jgi:hypothetical protein